MDPYVKALARALLSGMLPYPDSGRRRRVRKAARALVVCEPWPADADITGSDVAQLALLRVLHLQKQVRRAARFRMPDAAVQLARSALETCSVGLYCLHSQDAVGRLREANIKAMVEAVGYLIDVDLLTQEVLDESAALLVEAYQLPKGKARPLPSFKEIVETVNAKMPGSGVMSLYKRFYSPTSTFFVHANAPSLLRHVRPDNTLSDTPSFPWTYRSAVRVADAVVGLLAAAIAQHSGSLDGEFTAYADAHIARAFTPVAAMVGKSAFRPGMLWKLRPFAREVRAMREYTRSGQAAADPPEVREERIRAAFAQAFRQLAVAIELDLDSPEGRAFTPFMEYLVARVIRDITAEMDAAESSTGTDPADGTGNEP